MENEMVLYTDENGKTNVSVRFADEDVWVTQAQLAQIYNTSQQNISLHIDNIYKDSELPEKATHKDFLLVQKEGARNVKRNIAHYNLDVIIAIGYRVQSDVAVRFRRWATQRLHEYIQKGFTMDDERLKQGRNRYFRELLQRIRDIRSSERNFYQQVTDIYATATDYDPRSKTTLNFFATVQNKLHYAVHEHTAAELIYERINALDNQIVAHQRKILEGKGSISHDQAMKKAEKEYEIFRRKQLANLKSDFDLFLKDVKALEKG